MLRVCCFRLIVLSLLGSFALPALAVPPKGGLPLLEKEEYVVSVNGLLSAINNKDVDAVASLLDKGAKVNDNEVSVGGEIPFNTPGGGDTPLIRAAKRGFMAIVQLLLKRGADVNLPNVSTRSTALHYAAGHGDMALARLLLEHGAKLNVSDSQGETPLMYALVEGEVEVFHLLLEHGADVDLQNAEGCNVLMMVMDPPYRIGAHRLFEPLPNPTRLKMVQTLIAKRAKLNLRDQEGYTALMLALERGDTFLARELENAGASTEGANEARLIHAAQGGDLDEVQELLAKGANPNARNRSGDTALSLAAGRGHITLTRTLLAKGAEVDARSKIGGKTALMVAVGNPYVAKALLDAGANVHLKDEDGNNVFLFALERGYSEVVQMLLDRGFNAQTQIRDYPPLVWAAKYLNVGAARVLLNRGANIHTKDRYGNTALHHVMEHTADRREVRLMLELLLSRGADINARNKEGETPLTLALHNNRQISPEDIDFLRKRGAVGDPPKPEKDDP
jgi:uncharacterized protein